MQLLNLVLLCIMPKYYVEVTRTSYSSRTLEIEARDDAEAEQKALDTAGNYEFSEGNAEYDVEVVELVED